jgi:hypothetical protein
MYRFLSLLTSCVIVLAAGCGSPTATVSGTISFDGNPLNSGFILFQASDGAVKTADIQPDGIYNVPELPPGPARIAINVPSPPPRGPDGVSADPPEAFDFEPVLIPPKYGDIETSGLTFEISHGGQVHDIALD